MGALMTVDIRFTYVSIQSQPYKKGPELEQSDLLSGGKIISAVYPGNDAIKIG